MLKACGKRSKFQEDKQAIEAMAEAKMNPETLTASDGLSSNDLAVLALQEVIRYFWLGIHDLGLVSMLSIRTCQSTRNGRVWRRVVRAMFPQHPFEVNGVGFDAFFAAFVLNSTNYHQHLRKIIWSIFFNIG